MDWLQFLDVAADGGAFASTCVAMHFGYRTLTVKIEKETVAADLQRQLDCATYTGIAGAMAAVAFGVALLTI